MQIKNGQKYVLNYLKSTKSTKIFKFLLKVSNKCYLMHVKTQKFSFAINSVSDFDSASESHSESDSSLAFMNLDICIFFTLCLHSSK